MRFTEKRKETRKITKDIVVFYHADCTDGFTAAWVAYKKFGNKADYLPVFHEYEPPKIKNKEVYMVDMTFPIEWTQRLIRDNKRVTAIDHHISVKDITLSTYKPLYALNHSGCVLAWHYFFPNKTTPKFLLNVEDNDIWNHKIKNSREFYRYLELFDFDFSVWSKLVRDFENPKNFKKIIETGKILLEYESKIVDYSINYDAKLVEFEGHVVYSINTSYSVSETGAKLCRLKKPFAIIWCERKDGIVSVSLRGVGNIDCSKIAAKYGGGGHKLSAGFRLKSLKDIPWTPVVERSSLRGKKMLGN